MTSRKDADGLGRRDFVRVGAGAAVAAAASGAASPATAQQEFDYGGWFEDVPNFESTADHTGEDEVRVTVGPGGDLVFDPPAIHVDPGTTVVWEWDQGFHNVAEKESGERYTSETTDESGMTYSVTFEGEGISTYVCEPHQTQGMKGAVAVGSGEGDLQIEEGEMQQGGGGGGSGGGGSGGSGEGGEGGSGEGGDHGGSVGLDDVTSNPLALVGLAGVLAFLSPIALVVLLFRNAKREAEEY